MKILLVLPLIVFSVSILTSQTPAQAQSAQPVARKNLAKKAAKRAAPEPPTAPLPPPPPPTLEQMPAVPPQVHYSPGRLSIVAENSTLADILRAVRIQTGAAVDIPSNANERVVGHFGPGPARDVLAALLHGSHFNYVLVGSPAHPDGVDRLILTSKSGGTAEPGLVVAPAQNNNQVEVDEAATPTPEVEAPGEEPTDSANGAEPPPTPDGEQAVKTPEQLLRELQQQQLLQQQQQQQGQPGTPPPPN